MQAALLGKLFGPDEKWHGPCTIIMNAEAALRMHGSDSIVSGGLKMYAPRTVSGRITADAVCLLPDNSALLIVQQHKCRQDTGEENIKQLLTVADPAAVVAVEFLDVQPLELLGVAAPTLRTGPGSFSQQGLYPRPT
jgi:hypothetical protein